MKVIFFSFNTHKIKEVTRILKNNSFNILNLNDFPKTTEPDEIGKTFKKNAIIKSNFGFNKFHLPCFADDSGICISALNNKPGAKSKRFIEENGGLKKTFELIIGEVKRKKNFNAFFQTTLALTIKQNITICFKGVVRGKIALQPMGSKGFGYDPIFIPEGRNNTFAQMLTKEKNQISHRAIALIKLKIYLEKLFN